MVKKRFVSNLHPNSDEWIWPVLHKSESDRENFLTSTLPWLFILAFVPRLSFVFILVLWILYRIDYINYSTIKRLVLFSGALWLTLGAIAGYEHLFGEFFQSVIWKSYQHNLSLNLSFWFLRSTFFSSLFVWFCIYYNRRWVNPEKVHIKVVIRQRHERLRLMRRWQKTLDLKEVL